MICSSLNLHFLIVQLLPQGVGLYLFLDQLAGLTSLLNHASNTITSQRYVKPNLHFLRSAMQVVVAELESRMQVGQLVQDPIMSAVGGEEEAP